MLRIRFCTCYCLRVSVMTIRLASNGRSPHGYVQTTPVSRPPPTTLVASPRWPVKKCGAQALKHSVFQCLFSCLCGRSPSYTALGHMDALALFPTTCPVQGRAPRSMISKQYQSDFLAHQPRGAGNIAKTKMLFQQMYS